MDTLYPRCAGLDVHKETVVACVGVVDAGGPCRRGSPDLRHHDRRPAGPGRLAGRPRASPTSPWNRPGSTGSRSSTSWKAASRSCWSTPRHIKQVPGRKTDVKDCEWIAQLLQHGLLRPSFMPAAADPRTARPDPAAEPVGPPNSAAVANRIQKVLEDANIKLAAWRPTCWGSRAGPCSRP